MDSGKETCWRGTFCGLVFRSPQNTQLIPEGFGHKLKKSLKILPPPPKKRRKKREREKKVVHTFLVVVFLFAQFGRREMSISLLCHGTLLHKVWTMSWIISRHYCYYILLLYCCYVTHQSLTIHNSSSRTGTRCSARNQKYELPIGTNWPKDEGPLEVGA